jgi:hypothetical protein
MNYKKFCATVDEVHQMDTAIAIELRTALGQGKGLKGFKEDMGLKPIDHDAKESTLKEIIDSDESIHDDS